MNFEAIYRALDLELIESQGGEDRLRCADWDGHHKHGDRTGKLFINRNKLVYNCWVGGGGSLVQLIANIRGCSYNEAREWQKQFENEKEGLDDEAFEDQINDLYAESDKKKEVVSLPYFNEGVLDAWDHPHDWFAERGISEEIRKKARCGYRRDIDAIILPHFFGGKLVGWQTRWLDGRKPKYKNTSNMPREHSLWGYDWALKHAYEAPIIVESVATALMLWSQGYSAMATFGAEVNKGQSRLLRIFSEEGIVLSRDNDAAGKRWQSRLIEDLIDYIPISSLGLVEGEGADLGDLSEDLETFIENQEVIYSIP